MAGTGYTIGATNTATVLINPQLRVELFPTLGTVAEEAGSAEIRVMLSRSLSEDLTVSLTTMDDTATAGLDYTALTAQDVTFTAGVTEQTINITLLSDDLVEADETFTLSVDTPLPTGVTASALNSVTVTITSEDAPALELTAPAGDVTLTAGESVAITLRSTNGDAVDNLTALAPVLTNVTGDLDDADYSYIAADGNAVAAGAPLTLPSGQAEWTFMLQAVTDSDTQTESADVTITVLNRGGAGLLTFDFALTINPPVGTTVGFTTTALTVAENAGTAALTLQLNAALSEALTVSVTTTDGTATAGEDYTALSAEDVIFAIGDTSATVNIALTDDGMVELDETFTVSLDTPLPSGVSGLQTSVTVTLTSEDIPILMVGPATLEVTAGESGTISFSSTNGRPTGNLNYTVRVTGDPTFDGTNEFTLSTMTLGNGSQLGNITVWTINLMAVLDADTQPESATITIVPTDFTITGSSDIALTINPPPPSLMVSFASGTARVGEAAGTLAVTVQLNVSPSDETVVPIMTDDGTAVAGEDYTALAGAAAMVTFAANATGAALMQTVEVAITDDNVSEGNETFTLSFGPGSLPTGLTAGTPDSVTVTVVDDEVATVSFTGADAVSVAEDAGTVELTVELSTTPSGAVRVMLQTADGTAAAGSDYTALAGDEAMVVFPSGATGAALRQTVSVAITDDDTDELDEMFTVSLGGLPSGVGGGGTVTVTITDDDTPTVSFTGAATRTVAETVSTVVLTVALDIAPVTTLTIPVMTSGGTATVAEDYRMLSGNVVFAAGTTALMQTVGVMIINDEDDENDETFTVGFGTPPPGVATGALADVTVTITDDDVPMVSFAAAGTVSEEAGSVDLQVELDIAPVTTLSIPVMTIDGTATAGEDYTALSGAMVTFVAGTATLSQTVTVTLLSDTAPETDETFMAFFGPLPTGVVAGTLNRITVTLTDDDVLLLSVAAFPASVREGAASTLTITATMPAPDDLTIPYTISGTGITDADYTLTDTLGNAVTSPVTLPIGRTSVALTLTAAADADGEETLTYTLTTAVSDAGYTVDTTADAAEVTITPMDLVVELTADAVTVAEGDGMATVTARLIGGTPDADLVVPITVTAGTAQEGSDYTDPTTASVTFPMNATGAALMQTVMIPITDDAVYERDERFTVALGVPPGNVSFGAVDSATVTITDNDALTVGLTEATATVGEAGGSVTLTVQVATGTVLGTDVAITLVSADGTARSGEDYTGLSDAMVTFAAGATGADLMQTVSVPILQDAANENNEMFTVSLGPLPPRATAGPQSSTTVTITDDDELELSVTAGATEITEEESTTLTIRTNGVLSSAVAVAFVLSRPITSGEYTLTDASGSAVTSPVMLAPGQTSAMLTLTATNTMTLSDRTLTLTLVADPNYTVNPTAMAATVTVTPLVLTAELLPATRRVTENASVSGLLLLTASLNRSPAVDVMLGFSAQDGTARAGSDFRLVTTAVPFRAGASGANLSTSVIVEILNDNLAENEEMFTVTMGLLGVGLGVTIGGLEAFGNMETVVTILDDETPAVSFTSAQVAVGEADSMVALTLELNSSPTRTLTIPVTTTDGTARAGSDYTALSGATVTFASGATGAALRQTVNVPILADTADEIDEAFIVSLGTLPTGVSAGGIRVVTVTITDDDTPTVSFTSATASIDEANGPVSVTVQLDSTPVTPVLVLINTRDGTAMAGEDYTALSELVMFAAGATGDDLMQTVAIEITDGRVYEGVTDETFTVSWGPLPSSVTAGTPSAVTVTILEDDIPNVSMAAATLQVFEGAGAVTVTVQLSGTPRADHDIPDIFVLTSGFTATDDDDFTQLTGATVTFAAGATGADLMQTVSIPIIDDDDTEGDETFVVSLVQVPGDVTYNGRQVTEVTIIDNDAAVPELLVSLSSSDAAITDPADIYEGESVTLTIAANRAPANDLPVAFLVRGVSGADYTLTAAGGTAVSSPLTLPSGETSLALTLMAVNDADTVMETLTFLLREDPAGGTGYTRRTDQDTVDVVLRPAAELALSASASALAEYRGSVAVTAQWSGGVPSADLVVPLETSGTATRGPDADYELCTRETTGTDCTDLVFSVAFAAGGGASQSRVIPVSTRDDILTEGDEVLTLSLDTAGLPTRGLILGRTSVTLTITEGAEPVLSLGAGLTVRVNEEARTLSLPLEYTGAAVDQVTVPFSVTAGSATAGSDYRLPAETTVILNATPGQAGSVSRAVALIDILADDINEGDERSR